MIIQAELDDRERTHKMVEDGKVVFKEELDWKKMTVDQLNDYISKAVKLMQPILTAQICERQRLNWQ